MTLGPTPNRRSGALTMTPAMAFTEASLLLILSACGALEPRCSQPDVVEGEADLRVLTYNIGNGSKSGPYALRIGDQAYEDHVGERIRTLEPDIVFLQEVLPPTRCETFDELDSERVCYRAGQRVAPAKRLLGDEYTVVCDANRHVECMGVKASFGAIRGVPLRGFGLDKAETAGLPGRPCDYLAGDCDGESTDCDSESSVSSVVVDTRAGALRLIHAHPTAIGEICLNRQLEQAFAMVDDLPTVLAGDWNFDPSRLVDVAATALWADWVGENRRFRNHSEYGEDCRLDRTSVGQDASLDRVVTDFARGGCYVWAEPRLDDEFELSKLTLARIDHYAVDCNLKSEIH